ncbi:MAG: TenA family transcriptional regulator [Thermoprotei archaeon]|nr:TenA family transcriptional regulator [Thermoprotei archaeon]
MIIEKLREELRDVNEKILSSRSVTSPTMDVLRGFVANQLYIVPHDLKALSVFMVKARDSLEYEFVKMLIDGDYNAYKALLELAGELKVSFSYDALSPAAVAYTHFLSWLSLHGTMGDLAVAASVNLPVWGENCGKLSVWARSVGVRNTMFMDMFSGPYTELESMAEKIAERYSDWGRYRFIAKAIQYYELMFWEALA